MKTKHPAIENRIKNAARSVIGQMIRADPNLAAALKAKGNLHLSINSSFLYRDKQLVKTSQSSSRLVAKMAHAANKERLQDLSVADDLNLKSHYRIESSSGKLGLKPLGECVSSHVNSIGDVLFVLIGTVTGVRKAEHMVEGSAISSLRLDPTLRARIKLAETTCVIKEIVPIEDLLAHVAIKLGPSTDLPDKDRQAIARSYEALLDELVTEVVIPTTRSVDRTNTILGKIVESLRMQTAHYKKALDNLQAKPSDHQLLNEVLRIAYNFSTDVLPLIYLFMSICDLKPVVFWCTLDKQWALHRAFASLPWSALGRKEKLQEYQEIVAAARSHAFHHVLPFDTTVEVSLTNLDVRAEVMRLFLPYGKKEERGLRFRDQELAEVLAEFSRAKERPVSIVFWNANLPVMKAATDLADGVLDALFLIYKARLS